MIRLIEEISELISVINKLYTSQEDIIELSLAVTRLFKFSHSEDLKSWSDLQSPLVKELELSLLSESGVRLFFKGLV